VVDLCDCAASGLQTSSHERGCYTEMSAVRVHCAICWREASGDADGTWCPHLLEYIKKGLDAEELDFGIQFDVPLIPKWDMFANVAITTESIADICAPLVLLVEDLFTNSVEEHDLGLWSKGEGMWSIRSVCFDWMRGRAGIELLSDRGKCKSSAHNPFKHDRTIASLSSEQVMLHNWVLACHGLCLPEYEQVTGIKSNLVPDAKD
jgi:hypothetical protein